MGLMLAPEHRGSKADLGAGRPMKPGGAHARLDGGPVPIDLFTPFIRKLEKEK